VALDATADPASTDTVPAFVRAIAARYGDRPALELDGEVLTYRGLDEASAALGRGLLARGVGKGTRVGLLLANTPAFAVAWAAVTRIGALAVAMSTFYKAAELRRVIRHADLQGIIAQPSMLSQDFVAHLEQAFPELATSASADLVLRAAPYLRWIAMSGDDPPPWAVPHAWLESGADGTPFDDALLAEVESEVHPTDLATLIYTSGQSADPKGVPHTHGSIISKTHYLRDMMGITADARPEAMMPFFWVGGMAVTLLPTLEAGGTIICRERSMVSSPPLGTVGGPVATEPLPGWKGFPGLGMSETFAMFAWGYAGSAPGHSYIPMDFFEPGYDVKVVGRDGSPVAEGQRGEILLRGPTVTPGHYKIDRDKLFDADGYYRTGDEGEFEGTRLHFLGRLGDMIKTSMANVAPPEVERELVAIDGIVTAHVVALPDQRRGQLVGAAIVVEEGRSLDARAITAELRSRLSSYKVPRRIAFVTRDEIPLTPSNKVDKRRLAALIKERAVPSEARPD
jgi:acyl-CoA synthetase (AMP-forming)/AMP-acid ligase II